MNWLERQAFNVGLILARKKLEGFMGSGWKGKVGGIGSMASGAGLVLAGVACFAGVFGGNEHADVELCLRQILEGAGLFTLGLGTFGNRQAIASVEKGVLDTQVAVIDNTLVTQNSADATQVAIADLKPHKKA